MGFAIEVAVVSRIARRLSQQLEGKNFTASGIIIDTAARTITIITNAK
jgi:hypothetical protein